MKKNTPFVSVIVPIYNEEENIEVCINALLKNKYTNKEIILINDASTDNTDKIIIKYEKYKEIRIINHNLNRGIGASQQKGLINARGEIVAVTQGDTIVPSNWIRTIVKDFRNNNVSSVSGTYIPLKNSFISIANYIIDYILDTVLNKEINANKLASYNVAFIKKHLIKAGGFSTDLRWGNDPDVYNRLKSKNYKVYFDRRLKVKTQNEENFTKLIKRRFCWGRGSALEAKKNMLPQFKKIEHLAVAILILVICLNFIEFLTTVKPSIHQFVLWIDIGILVLALSVSILFNIIMHLKTKTRFYPLMIIALPVIAFARVISTFLGYYYQVIFDHDIKSWRSKYER
jgi:cellulose synthase/poly-beta-1,6-N-acetylglucosamine synthase-like glycosyltransferase